MFAIIDLLAKLWCGDSYMQAVDGIVGDRSCGFNADMYFMVGLLALVLIGVSVFIVRKKSSR